MHDFKAIAESNNFIVLDTYVSDWQAVESYQTESDLERELVQDLQNQGYEYAAGLNSPEKLLANVRAPAANLEHRAIFGWRVGTL